jgi:hypothetical protein
LTHFEDSVVELQNRVSQVSQSLGPMEWSALEKDGFVAQASQTVRSLNAVADALSECEHFAELAASDTASDFRTKKLAALELLGRLEKNVELERGKSSARISDELFAEKKRFNSHFSGLHHEVRTLLLQLSYLCEHASLDSRRLESSPLKGPSSQKTLLHLLREKESEVQGLKAGQVEWQKKALVGRGSEPSVSDIEHEATLAASRLKVIQSRLDAAFAHHSELSARMPDSLSGLQHELIALQEAVSRMSDAWTDLHLRLKRESEFAREVAFRVEHETAGLRGKYTHQMLNQQEAVEKAREDESMKTAKRLAALESENRKQHELLLHFKSVVEGKEKSLERLENDNVRLRLLLTTHMKHKMVKDAFLGPKASSPKRHPRARTIKKRKK